MSQNGITLDMAQGRKGIPERIYKAMIAEGITRQTLKVAYTIKHFPNVVYNPQMKWLC